METNTITLTDQERHEIAAALSVQINTINARMRWQERKPLCDPPRPRPDGLPLDMEKERSIYAKRAARVAFLQELRKRFEV